MSILFPSTRMAILPSYTLVVVQFGTKSQIILLVHWLTWLHLLAMSHYCDCYGHKHTTVVLCVHNHFLNTSEWKLCSERFQLTYTSAVFEEELWKDRKKVHSEKHVCCMILVQHRMISTWKQWWNNIILNCQCVSIPLTCTGVQTHHCIYCHRHWPPHLFGDFMH